MHNVISIAELENITNRVFSSPCRKMRAWKRVLYVVYRLGVTSFVGPQAVLQTGIHNSVFLPSIPSSQKGEKSLPVCWDKNIKLLPGVSSIKFNEVPKWTPDKVANQLKRIIPTLSDAQLQQFSREVSLG